MNGLSTEEIMQLALDLAGWDEIPQDSGIQIAGGNIQKLIFSMDVNVGLLHMAKQLGFDAVVGHHCVGVLLHQGEVYRRHIDLLELYGVPREKALHSLGKSIDTWVRRSENSRFRMLFYESPNQTVLEVDAARMLDLPFMNIHNPLDEMGRKILQAKFDAAAQSDPQWKLGDVLNLIAEMPEAQYAGAEYGISPGIFVGTPDCLASRVVFMHGALSAPDADVVKFCWENGLKTVVALHCEFSNLERLKNDGQGNLILTGHFLGDSIGMTPFIKALRQKGVTVACMGGVIDIGDPGR